MAAGRSKTELLAIVGPTASGKSDLAVRVAKRLSGEIIAADSRTVFKGLNIGTAKPLPQDLEAVPHWGIDLIDPGTRFTAADFKNYADTKIDEIIKRNKLPVLVGGTGLYIDSVLYDFTFRKSPAGAERANLETLSTDQLREVIAHEGYAMPENQHNRRHLIRTIETKGESPSHAKLRPKTMLVGIWPPDEVLQVRIDQRAEAMFSKGVIEEFKALLRSYPDISMTSVGIVYELCSEVVSSSLSIEEAKRRFKHLDWQYARRQKTWFKRNHDIRWFEDTSAAEQFIYENLNT